MPESPAYAALAQIRRRKADGDVADAEELSRRVGLTVSGEAKATLRDVFAPGLRRHTICLSLAWLFNWMAIQVFSVLGTTVLTQGKHVSFSNALLVLVLANAVGFAGYLFHGWVGDRIGRRTTIIVGWSIGAVLTGVMLLGPSSSVFVIAL
ncbi:MFS transporter [Streptomyces flaveolus]|uniref:MFS transporter n=1 Tax=Streptomyces flaveolus TaxID=67297 RepID=A0ABV3APC2_9ACTN|nr:MULTISPECIES: MFS transporter [Streptomyces]